MKEKLSTFRSWLKRLTINYGITGTVFILSFVFVAIFAYEFLTGFNEPPEPELNLAGQWEVCVSENADSRACKWHSMKIPSDIPKEYLVNFKGWAIYRTKFNAPDICEEQKSACAFFFGEIGDAAEAHLNGKFIGRHGQFPPHAVYAKHYPVSFQIPKESLKRGTVKN